MKKLLVGHTKTMSKKDPNSRELVSVPPELIQQGIYVVREQRVMLDADLASLYGVTTGNLNKAVSRNKERFPEDFMFRLNTKEFEVLRFQVGTSSSEWGGRRYPPYAFTENGVAMLSSVLRSKRAIRVNMQIMRTFTKLREVIASNKKLAKRVEQLEGRVALILDLMAEESDYSPKKKMGF